MGVGGEAPRHKTISLIAEAEGRTFGTDYHKKTNFFTFFLGVCPSVCLSVADSILKKIVRGKLWSTLSLKNPIFPFFLCVSVRLSVCRRLDFEKNREGEVMEHTIIKKPIFPFFWCVSVRLSVCRRLDFEKNREGE